MRVNGVCVRIVDLFGFVFHQGRRGVLALARLLSVLNWKTNQRQHHGSQNVWILALRMNECGTGLAGLQ